jgi:DNA-binding NarL/FixJ family response regulator
VALAGDSPTVVLADDHPHFRIAIRDELEAAGFVVRAEAGDAPEAIRAVIREKPHLCLLDVTMPGDGLHAAAEIRRRVPATRVVMLTASELEEHVIEAARAGACGYLLKDGHSNRLPDALRDVLRGIPSFPQRFAATLSDVASAIDRSCFAGASLSDACAMR